MKILLCLGLVFAVQGKPVVRQQLGSLPNPFHQDPFHQGGHMIDPSLMQPPMPNLDNLFGHLGSVGSHTTSSPVSTTEEVSPEKHESYGTEQSQSSLGHMPTDVLGHHYPDLVNHPDLHLPDFHMPDIHMPDVHFPDIDQLLG